MRVAGPRSVNRISWVMRFSQSRVCETAPTGATGTAAGEGRTTTAPPRDGPDLRYAMHRPLWSMSRRPLSWRARPESTLDAGIARRPRFTARSRTSRPPVSVIEFRRSAAYPADEGGDVGVFAQSLRRGEVTRQFVLAQYGVQLAVADAMHRNRDTPALRLRHQVVLIHHRSCAHRSSAQRTGRVVTQARAAAVLRGRVRVA